MNATGRRRANAFAAGIALSAAAAILLTSAEGAAQSALATKGEAACAKKIALGAAKLSKVIAKQTAKCRDKEIAGKTSGPCPDAKAQAKIDKAALKLEAAAQKKCGSACSVSAEIGCLGHHLCPPLGRAQTPAAEQCTAGAKNKPFDMRTLGFPGPFCEALLGGPIVAASDLGRCVALRTSDTTEDLLEATYGGITSASGITEDAAKCLKLIGKDVQKLVDTAFKGVVKCRDKINKGKVAGNPATCRTDDEKLAAKILAREAKLSKTLATKCSDALVAELDLCHNGPGGTLDTSQAKVCLVEAALEIADGKATPAFRQYSPVSLVDAAYPPDPVCGDDVVNQSPSPFLLLGEECDGTDDSACPGACIPPGDVFECTCGDARRMRFVADGFTADLDNGWSGTSHNSGVADGAGYVVELSGCDCDQFSGATCTGATSDAVCDVTGLQLPTCSWDASRSTRCDAAGNGDGRDEDRDCFVCDAFAANAGDFCVNEGGCDAQCYDAAGTVTGPCVDQTDCAAGEVCRGQCDRSQTCFVVPNGAPLPISSGGTAVCVVNSFREDVTGTQDIVTGEHESFIRQFSKVHLGVTNAVPCPLCGGFCDGGSLDGEVCQGTCDASGDPCRFDHDCPVAERCTTASADCPGGFCNLSLVCRGGTRTGQPCRVEAGTKDFGTTSNDCPPLPAQNISGQGLAIDFLPQTSETVSLPATLACTNPGLFLYDCPCPDAGGLRTRPNLCAAACNAGTEAGQGCATGGGSIDGRLTSCAGGANAGFACDEDSDCPGGSCSANPSHCSGTGDPLLERKLCASDAECGAGACVDACPAGRCVPLCLPSGADPEEGMCAAGPPFYHCSGASDTFRTCTANEATGGCPAVCAASCSEQGVASGGSGAPCDPQTTCPGDEVCCGSCTLAKTCAAGVDGVLGNGDDLPGAGICVADDRNCFVGDITAEGGDVFNGKGDPTNVRSVSTFCIGATSSSAINSVAGLGGPGRLRQQGVNVTNGFDAMP